MVAEFSDALTYLRGLLDELMSGSSALALVSGQMGSGKTRLLHEFAHQAINKDALVLHAIASRIERNLQMGVVEQMLHHKDVPAEMAQRASHLVANTLSEPMAPAGQLHIDHIGSSAVFAVCRLLMEICKDRPVVITVDDIQFADAASLQVLLYLQRRMLSRRMLMILSEWEHSTPSMMFRAEITRIPHHRIELMPLSVQGVQKTAARTTDHATATRLAPTFHDWTGGNAILVNALIEDFRVGRDDGEGSHPTMPAVGRAFGEAVLTCLHRCEPYVLDVAGGLVILEKHASPVLLGRLLDLDQERVKQSIRILTGAGLIAGNDFRHRATASTILATLSSGERSALQLRAAQLLFDIGAAATDIAAHFLAAENVGEKWATPVLCEAAEREFVTGEGPKAVRYLRLALKTAADEDQYISAMQLLLRIAWSINPSAALRYRPALEEAMTQGKLADYDIVRLIKLMLWQGDVETASASLAAISEMEISFSRGARAELLLALHWLHGAAHKKFGNFVDQDKGVNLAENRGEEHAWLDAINAFSRVWSQGGDEDSASAAERLLRQSRLGRMPLEALSIAVLALAYSDNPDRALYWCDELIERADQRGVTTWLAQLKVLRAEVCLRGGDPEGALESVTAAMALLGEASWGVTIGHPLSILIQANVAMGRIEEAAEAARRPVPAAMFETVMGIRYLHARGRLALAMGRTAEALDDFRTCAERLDDWDLEIPVLVPVAISLAEAALKIGEEKTARDMVMNCLKKPSTVDNRTQGILLRLLAETVDLARRPAILLHAVASLHASRDRFECAGAQAQLRWVHEELGHRSSAPGSSDAVEAAEASVTPIQSARAATETLTANMEEPAAARLDELSDAERRVTILAMQGHTNRDISRKLWITISTVEQHLTRVYRKLGVRGRADLPDMRSELGSLSAVHETSRDGVTA
jgi:DNA-binding CsgD family transcriptional regulator/tetratricopeptide (TPR) repeat protein